MTDHKAEAERLSLPMDGLFGGMKYATGSDKVAAAQVHATLYLAEQQRIANLIAVSALFTTGDVTPDPDYWTPARLRKLGSDLTEGLTL